MQRRVMATVVVVLSLLAVLLIVYLTRPGPSDVAPTPTTDTGSFAIHNDSTPLADTSDLGMVAENNSTFLMNNSSRASPTRGPSGGPGLFPGGKPPGDMKGGPPNGQMSSGGTPPNGQMPNNATSGGGSNVTPSSITRQNTGPGTTQADAGITPGSSSTLASMMESMMSQGSSYMATVTAHMPTIKPIFKSVVSG